MADGPDIYGGQDVAVVPTEPTDEGVALILLARGSYAAGCYRLRAPLHPPTAAEARLVVVPWWSDHRAAPFWPGDLPAGAVSLRGTLLPAARSVSGSVVGGVAVSRQYVALVCRAWGADVVWAPVSRGAARFLAAWKLRAAPAAGVPFPVAALAPLGERAGRVDPVAGERAEA